MDLPDFVPAVPVDLPDLVPADLAEPVPAAPVDLAQWRVLAVVREAEGPGAEGRVVVVMAVGQVVEATAGATAVVPNGSMQRGA